MPSGCSAKVSSGKLAAFNRAAEFLFQCVDVRMVAAFAMPGAVERLVSVQPACMVDAGALSQLANVMQESGNGNAGRLFDHGVFCNRVGKHAE